MTKKKEIKLEKLTDNVTYHIEGNTIYLLLKNNNIGKEEFKIVYKKITLIIEDNDISYINISGKHLEENKEYFINLGFTLSYYDVNKLNTIYAGVHDKRAYRCYGIMTKKDFYSKINEENKEPKPNTEILKESTSNAGFVSNMLLLLFGIALLCFFCVQGAIYLVK